MGAVVATNAVGILTADLSSVEGEDEDVDVVAAVAVAGEDMVIPDSTTDTLLSLLNMVAAVK